MRYCLSLLCILFINLFGLFCGSVLADEVEINQSNTISYRYDDDSSWGNISGATELVSGHTYQVRFQFTPFYSFLDGHYYKLRLIFAHNAGSYSFDYANFYNSSYQGTQIDTSTYSATFNNVDSGHCQLILDGVRDIDVNRQIQRIRFFFNDTVAIDSGYNSASIRINDVHLYVEDVTSSYVLPELNDKLDSTNSKLDQAEETRGGILQKLRDLPDTIFHVFVPTSEEFSNAFSSFRSSIEGRLGFIGQFNTLISNLTNKIRAGLSNPTSVIHVPNAQLILPIPGNTFLLPLWSNATLDLWPFGNGAGITVLRTLISFVFVGLFLRYISSLYYRVFGKGGETE